MNRTSKTSGGASSKSVMIEILEGRQLLSATLHPTTASSAPIVVAPVGSVTLHERVGQLFTASVGTFLTIAPAKNLHASINWGDSSSSVGTLKSLGPVGLDEVEFQVTGAHTYAKVGTYSIIVTVTQPGPTPTSLLKLIATIDSTAIVSGSVIGLDGSISGKYALAPTAAGVGATYVFNGTGTAGALGPVSGQGSVTLPALGTSGPAHGTLTLTSIGATSAASGSVTLALTGPVQTSSGPFPSTLDFTIIGGTGAFAGATGSGTITVTLGQGGANGFTFAFHSLLPPTPVV